MHAKLLSGGQDDATHNRLGTAGMQGTGGTCRGTGGQRRSQDDTQTTSAAGLEGTGGTGRPGCGAGGRRRGLAGQRVDAPSEARSADGGRAAAHGHTKQPGPTTGSSTARNTSGAINTAGTPAAQHTTEA